MKTLLTLIIVTLTASCATDAPISGSLSYGPVTVKYEPRRTYGKETIAPIEPEPQLPIEPPKMGMIGALLDLVTPSLVP